MEKLNIETVPPPYAGLFWQKYKIECVPPEITQRAQVRIELADVVRAAIRA